MSHKTKLASYWASGCGGCDMSIMELGAKLIKIADKADFVFWPCIMDFKYDNLKAMPDKSIDACFFNGAICNEENAEIAKLLREKSKILVSHGSCANTGGIPALANFSPIEELFERVYKTADSTLNRDSIIPQTKTSMPEGDLFLPKRLDSTARLDSVVEVDYYVPGCPPEEKTTLAAIDLIMSGKLPEKGSVIGAGDKIVCDECPFAKRGVKISGFKRLHLAKPDLRPCRDLKDKPLCLLEQGFICLGPATRSGCEARCLAANFPCRGCYGPGPEVSDQAIKMVSILGSLIDAQGSEKKADDLISQVADPAGTLERFSMAKKVRK